MILKVRSWKTHLLVGSLAALAGLEAGALTFTASDAAKIILPPNAQGWNDTADRVATAVGVSPGSVGELLYKYDLGDDHGAGKESGGLSLTYSTSVDRDEKGFTLSSVTGVFPIADASYLVAKDGKHAHYIFSLAGWDGLEAIQVDGLWPDNGSLSHVSLYGGVRTPVVVPPAETTQVPDGGSTGLFLALGVSVLGIGWVGRQRW